MSSLDQLPPVFFEPISPLPGDIIVSESESESRHHPEYRATKRRRIEDIARQCSAAQPLFILSAKLKGPFIGSRPDVWAKKDTKLATKIRQPHIEVPRPGHGRNSRPKPDLPIQGGQSSGEYQAVKQDLGASKGRANRKGLAASTHKATEARASLQKRAAVDKVVQNDQYKGRQDKTFNTTTNYLDLPPDAIYNAAVGRNEGRAIQRDKTKDIPGKAWLKAVNGSTYWQRPTTHNTLSPTSRTSPAPKRPYINRDQDFHPAPGSPSVLRRSRKLESSTVQEPIRSLASDEPFQPKIESDDEPSNYGPQEDTGKLPERPIPVGSDFPAEDNPGVLVLQTALAEADPETIQSWMRAKELSILAASQASQSCSLSQSKSPAISRPLPSPIRTIENVKLAKSIDEVEDSRSMDLKTSVQQRLSFSQPNPIETRGIVGSSATDNQMARSSPTRSPRNSYRVVPPSTNLPSFKYWRVKSAPAGSLSLEAEGAENIRDSAWSSAGVTTPSPPPGTFYILPSNKAKEPTWKENTKVSETPKRKKKPNRSVSVKKWTFLDQNLSKKNPTSLRKQEFESEQRTAKQGSDEEVRVAGEESNRPRKPSPVPDELDTWANHLLRRGQDNAATHNDAFADSGSAKEHESSMSTQAAAASMQRRFQAAIVTPAQEGSKIEERSRSREHHRAMVETPDPKGPIRSLLVESRRTLPSASVTGASADRPSADHYHISTQALLDAASPFTFSTIKQQPSASGLIHGDAREASAQEDPSGLGSDLSPATPTLKELSQPATVRNESRSPRKTRRKSPQTASASHTGISMDDGQMKPIHGGDGDEVEFDAALDELTDGFLEPWDVESALRKSSASEGMADVERCTGSRTTHRADQAGPLSAQALAQRGF